MRFLLPQKNVWALAITAGICFGCNRAPAAPAATGLADHVIAQLASRTNGANGNFVWIPDNQVVTAGNLYLDTNFFLRDVTNILAASQTEITSGASFSCSDYLTAISPHFCVTAAHPVAGNSNGFNGRKFLWLLPTGRFYTNLVTAGFTITNADLIVCRMARTNPFFCRVLPDVTRKVPALKYGASFTNPPLPAVLLRGGDGLPEPHTAFVLSLTSEANFGAANYGSPEHSFVFGGYWGHNSWIGGDSSSPAYVIINNEAALIGTASSALGSSCVSANLAAINSALATLANDANLPVETVTLFDVSAFPDY
jgi:hypothetical protein